MYVHNDNLVDIFWSSFTLTLILKDSSGFEVEVFSKNKLIKMVIGVQMNDFMHFFESLEIVFAIIEMIQKQMKPAKKATINCINLLDNIEHGLYPN